jgi:hypothetical protein
MSKITAPIKVRTTPAPKGKKRANSKVSTTTAPLPLFYEIDSKSGGWDTHPIMGLDDF